MGHVSIQMDHVIMQSLDRLAMTLTISESCSLDFSASKIEFEVRQNNLLYYAYAHVHVQTCIISVSLGACGLSRMVSFLQHVE